MADVIVRHARESDDYQTIASCIYLTDPFIYPAAFGQDLQQAASAISNLMRIDSGLFHPDNLALAFCGDEICGVLLHNRNGYIWDVDKCVEAVRAIVPSIENFLYVSEAYFSAEAICPPVNQIEIISCCVMPGFRKMGVGKKMLEWLIQEYPGYTMTLDVLADNQAAIALYQKCGFGISENLKGFSLTEESRPDCYRMIRKPVALGGKSNE